MKTLKLLTSAILMPVLSVVLLQSCSEEMAPELQLNSEAIETLQTKSMDAPAPEFAPLGVVPDWAKAKMTDEEVEMWEIIAQKHMVDYSFVENPTWQFERERINANLRLLMTEVVEGRIDKSNYLSVELDSNAARRMERLNNPEDFQTIEKNIRRVFSYVRFSIVFTAHVSSYILHGQTIETIIRVSNFEFPIDSIFSGSKGCHATNSGYIQVYCIGTVYYRGSSTEVDINEKVFF